MSKSNKSIPVDCYINGKYRYTYLSMEQAHKCTGVSYPMVRKLLRDPNKESNGYAFRYNHTTNPFIISNALIKSFEKINTLRLTNDNIRIYVIKIINQAKSLVDKYGEELISDINLFDVKVVTADDITEIVTATLQEIIISNINLH